MPSRIDTTQIQHRLLLDKLSALAQPELDRILKKLNAETQNFIINGNAEVGTEGWAVTRNTSAAALPDNGFIGTGTNITVGTTSTAPLSGSQSFTMVKDAANRQGQQLTYSFNTDNAAQIKKMSISFDYIVASGTFVAGTSSSVSDCVVALYDVTNGVFIPLSNTKLFSNSSTSASQFSCEFYTNAGSNSYRLVFHVATVSAAAWTLKFDNVNTSRVRNSPDISLTKAPTVQKFLSGSGTYTTPNNVVYIRVRMVGGGGGGGGGGFNNGTPGTGGNGGATTFGSSLLTCNGGAGGAINNFGGMNGGSATLNSPAYGTVLSGGNSQAGQVTLTGGGDFAPSGGNGGSSYFGGGGGGGAYVGNGSAGQANTGAGGGGGSGGNASGTVYSGAGGGAGAYIEAYIANPLPTYSYTVGAGGSGGAGGTKGLNGGNGAAGYIEVTEYYVNGYIKIDQAIPAGSVTMFAGSSIPTDYLLCNGSAVSRTIYANLFAAIGTTYGVGDGSTTFNLPNFSGIFPRGTGSQTVGGNGYGPVTLGNRAVDTVRAHTHTYTTPSGQGRHNHSLWMGSDYVRLSPGGGLGGHVLHAASANNGAFRIVAQDLTGELDSAHQHSGTTDLSSGSETAPVSIGINFIIRI